MNFNIFIISVLCNFITIISALNTSNTPQFSIETEWRKFQNKYKRNSYRNLKEHNFRYKIFENNFNIIKHHNERFERGLESYSMGINMFTDRTHEENLKNLGLKNFNIE